MAELEEGYRQCPYCAEPIRDEAVLCRYCNRDIVPNRNESTAPMGSAPNEGRFVAISVVVVVLVAALGAAAWKAHWLGIGGEDTMTVSGSFYLSDVGGIAGSVGNCYGTDGFSDITKNAQVTIRDSSGKTLGFSHLSRGLGRKGILNVLEGCTFNFKVTDVPKGKGTYTVEVSHRGQVNFTEADADSVQISLGS